MTGTIHAGQPLTDAALGTPPWQAITLQNSWTNIGTTNAQWRFVPLLNQIEVIGAIQNGTISNNTAISQALSPAPLTQLVLPIATENNSSAPVQTPAMYLDTSGVLRVTALPTGTTKLDFHLFFPVDS